MTRPASISAFTHTATSQGSARGMVISGKQWMPAEPSAFVDKPLIIAVHGGSYTSTYFDVPEYSLMACAAANGIPIIAIDRPGYGQSSALAPADSTIAKNAEVLNAVIEEIWAQQGKGAAGVVLIGHSIGGAVATSIAARSPSWPLLGLAGSGFLLDVPPESREKWRDLPDIPMIDLPSQIKDVVMFGPTWTHGTSAKEVSHCADAPCPRAELIDITTTWPQSVRAVTARVTVPVHFRQGEFDALWITDDEQVARFKASFSSSPQVDAQLFRSAGHCIDFHRVGRAFQLEQLAFALRCSVAAH